VSKLGTDQVPTAWPLHCNTLGN